VLRTGGNGGKGRGGSQGEEEVCAITDCGNLDERHPRVVGGSRTERRPPTAKVGKTVKPLFVANEGKGYSAH
jgi:hypothetical protein